MKELLIKIRKANQMECDSLNKNHNSNFKAYELYTVQLDIGGVKKIITFTRQYPIGDMVEKIKHMYGDL